MATWVTVHTWDGLDLDPDDSTFESDKIDLSPYAVVSEGGAAFVRAVWQVTGGATGAFGVTAR